MCLDCARFRERRSEFWTTSIFESFCHVMKRKKLSNFRRRVRVPAVRGIVAGVLFEIAMTPEFDELTPPEIQLTTKER